MIESNEQYNEGLNIGQNPLDKCKFGDKLNELPSETERKIYDEKLSEIIKLKQELIVKDRCKKKVSRAVWDQTRHQAKIVQNYDIPRWMGVQEGPIKWLYPEEALFLLESGALFVILGDVPLTIQEGYHFLIKNQSENNLFRVYSHLARFGYEVKKERKIQEGSLAKKDSLPVTDTIASETSSNQVLFSNSMKRCLSEQEFPWKYKKNSINAAASDLKFYSKSSPTVTEKVYDKACSSASSWLEFKTMLSTTKTESNRNFITQFTFDKDYNQRDLVDSSNTVLLVKNIQPLYDKDTLLSGSEVYNHLQQFGPKDSHETRYSLSDVNPILKVSYPPKSIPDNLPHDFKVIVVDVSESVCLEKLSNLNENVYVAVADLTDLCFFSLKTFSLNLEIPVLWQKTLNANLNLNK